MIAFCLSKNPLTLGDLWTTIEVCIPFLIKVSTESVKVVKVKVVCLFHGDAGSSLNQAQILP